MTRATRFGSGLRNQIILPMLATAVVAGIAAALLAVYILGGLTGRWVEDVARSTTDDYASRGLEYARQLQHEAGISVLHLRDIIDESPNDVAALRAGVASSNSAHGTDLVLLLDETGRVVAASGAIGLQYGSKPLGSLGAWSDAPPKTIFARFGEQYMLAAVRPVSRQNRYTLVVAHPVDEEFLRRLGVRSGFAVGLCDADHTSVAVAVGGTQGAGAARVRRALTSHSREFMELMARAEGTGSSSGGLRIGGTDYRARVRRITLGEGPAVNTTAYMTGLVREDITEETAATTRTLVITWVAIAVVVLALMGGYIARRVTDPLVELADGAKRIAEGDFNTKVRVGGSNEIAELAASFNTMTDSLRERSDTLTKKVLELASLYEMSRGLGSTLEMDELLGSVLDSALRVFDVDRGYVVLRDKETGDLSLRVLRGPEYSAENAAAAVGSMSDWVVREGRPLVFNPDASNGAAGQVDGVTGARAALCVPLTTSEGTIGSITIGSDDAGRRFNSDDVRLLSTIANQVTIAVGNIELFSSLQEAYIATVRSLAAAVDAKDRYTRGHSDHVARYSALIAERMGLSGEQTVALEMAAYLHDIGKIGVPEDILLKPGQLDDNEMEQMRHHPLIGANILTPVAFPWAINPVVRHHHEAYDGSGYPAGLRGEEIPLLARILTVADSFEAMTADRPYRLGRSIDDALAELSACSGTQFDPRVVEVFSAIVTELEASGEISAAIEVRDVSVEDMRDAFAALVDGVFAGFRTLGGSRLASNVERQMNAYFDEAAAGYRLSAGHLTYTEPPQAPPAELERMRAALLEIDMRMGRLSGGTLVEHFYEDALLRMSDSQRSLLRDVGLYER